MCVRKEWHLLANHPAAASLNDVQERRRSDGGIQVHGESGEHDRQTGDEQKDGRAVLDVEPEPMMGCEMRGAHKRVGKNARCVSSLTQRRSRTDQKALPLQSYVSGYRFGNVTEMRYSAGG